MYVLYMCFAACCANNTYGPNCEECNGGKERPCTGNGECDVSTLMFCRTISLSLYLNSSIWLFKCILTPAPDFSNILCCKPVTPTNEIWEGWWWWWGGGGGGGGESVNTPFFVLLSMCSCSYACWGRHVCTHAHMCKRTLALVHTRTHTKKHSHTHTCTHARADTPLNVKNFPYLWTVFLALLFYSKKGLSNLLVRFGFSNVSIETSWTQF